MNSHFAGELGDFDVDSVYYAIPYTITSASKKRPKIKFDELIQNYKKDPKFGLFLFSPIFNTLSREVLEVLLFKSFSTDC